MHVTCWHSKKWIYLFYIYTHNNKNDHEMRHLINYVYLMSIYGEEKYAFISTETSLIHWLQCRKWQILSRFKRDAQLSKSCQVMHRMVVWKRVSWITSRSTLMLLLIGWLNRLLLLFRLFSSDSIIPLVVILMIMNILILLLMVMMGWYNRTVNHLWLGDNRSWYQPVGGRFWDS